MENFKPTKPTLDQFTKYNSYGGNKPEDVANDLAGLVIDRYNDEKQETFKAVKNAFTEFLENDTTNAVKNFLEKNYGYPYDKISVPVGIAKKLVEAIRDIPGTEAWINEIEFHLSPIGKDFKKEYKDYVKKVNDFCKRIKNYSNNKIWVENQGWQGITGATERSRCQHLEVKAAPIIITLKNILLEKFINDKERAESFINTNNTLNIPETHSLLNFVNAFGYGDFDKYVIGKTFEESETRYGF